MVAYILKVEKKEKGYTFNMSGCNKCSKEGALIWQDSSDERVCSFNHVVMKSLFVMVTFSERIVAALCK